jgi:hypothetical protein
MQRRGNSYAFLGVRRKAPTRGAALLHEDTAFDDAGVNREAIVIDHGFAHGALQNGLEDVPERVAFSEPTVPVLWEAGMIGNCILRPQTAEPAIRRHEENSSTHRS